MIVKIDFKRFMVIYWPFVLQFQALLSILFHPFCLGAFVVEVDCVDLEANLFFCSALHVEVDFGDLEANLFFTVLFI